MSSIPSSQPLMTLEVKDLTIGFERPLIRNLTFSLPLGERLIIFGPNGIGKSTLLQRLLQNSPKSRWSTPPSQILYVQQQSDFHRQTPDDIETYLLHVLLIRRPWKRAEPDDYKKVASAMEKLGLQNEALYKLSGGQRQKVRLARGLLSGAKALLLDEPFNAVDSKSFYEMSRWLDEVQPETSQILVLHDFEQIERLQSTILWIQPDGWKILPFQVWFSEMDRQFHSWLHHRKEGPPSSLEARPR
jgi:ABC-type Mn2+/Zn2+ transport system ATPase subunit